MRLIDLPILQKLRKVSKQNPPRTYQRYERKPLEGFRRSWSTSVIFALFTMLFFSGCHQKDSVTAFRENHPIDLALTFYPSTLRMVNLAKNEEFNQLVKEVEKGRYYKVNKKEDTQQAIHTLMQDLQEEGYEEIMSVTGNANDVAVYTLERQNPVMVVIAEREEDYAIIQVEGMINIVQIPKLINSFNDEEFLNIFSIYDQKKPRQNIESDTTNNPAE